MADDGLCRPWKRGQCNRCSYTLVGTNGEGLQLVVERNTASSWRGIPSQVAKGTVLEGAASGWLMGHDRDGS